jgi:hypothetical protein
MLSHLLDIQAGNWWDVVNTPSALDAGTQRGVSNLNTDLHALERKRVLVASCILTDIPIAAAVAATGTLTSTGAFSDGETVTIGTQTYTFRSPFVDAANNINAAGTQAATHENLRRAINGDGVQGTNYGTGTPVNADVTAADTGTTNVLTAKKAGTFGNTVATTETGANISFGAATLTGGSGGDVKILTAGQLPSNLIAAVGAVTTRGTVLQTTGGTFGTADLAEVSGSTAISPKSIVEVVDATTRDPILSGGRVVYGLLQGESGLADGETIIVTTPERAQITFVRINSTGDDLETIDGTDLGGLSVNVCYTERKALDDLTEQDFLRGATTDVPSAATVTRQVAYNNQGTVPVDLTTNATLDLEGPGLIWSIRDDLEAALFRVIEGSAGGTSEVEISAGVDTFDVDAVLNDFLNGAAFDTGAAGTTINVGVTANQIDSGGALKVTSGGAGDLNLAGAAELNLTDSYRAGSTWGLVNGIALSDASSEWSLFETNFGEVSLLNAINQAYASAAGPSRGTKTYSNVTADTNADLDVSLADGNLDTALPGLDLGTFTDHDVYLNGNLLRGGADAAANHDYYPGTSITAPAKLKFEFKVKVNDVLAVVPWNP